MSSAGRSLRAQQQQAADSRAERNRDTYGGLVGGLVTRFGSASTAEHAFAAGAAGEEKVGRTLDRAVAGVGVVLHSRLPYPNAKRGDIDHIVIAPAGVFVVDSKNYSRNHIVVQKGRGGRPSSVTVGGRDGTKLVDGVLRQRQRLVDALASMNAGDVPVAAMVCFTDASGLGLWGYREVNGVTFTKRSRASARVSADGPFDVDSVTWMSERLNRLFPPVPL